ncbi:hypothetical protein N0018_31165, partial [Pseudomonas aeruginosa]|nr:hypothetical protein [Pseudomonas aeruginosa]
MSLPTGFARSLAQPDCNCTTATRHQYQKFLIQALPGFGPGTRPMSSTLEIIHKYHIISAQISAWEKPF